MQALLIEEIELDEDIGPYCSCGAICLPLHSILVHRNALPQKIQVLLCRPFIAAFIAFAIAQLLKVLTFWYSERRWDYTRVVGSGGMPSSHTACVSLCCKTFHVACDCFKPERRLAYELVMPG